MSEITELQVNRITEAANKINRVSRSLVAAAKEHKKGVIVASCVTGLVLAGAITYAITEYNNRPYVPVHKNKKCKCEEEKDN